MHTDLSIRRRVLILHYRRYLEADRTWKNAREDLKAWFPVARHPEPVAIGNPGSPIRKLYDRRDRALMQLQAARFKLETAKQRLRQRHREERPPCILLMPDIPHK